MKRGVNRKAGERSWAYMRRMKKKGQTTLEYMVVIVILLAAFLAMQVYIRRGLQGRMKSSIDELGDQYDPRAANTDILHTLVQTTNTSIMALNTSGGYWTRRTDATASRESKVGFMSLGNYD